MNSMVYNGAMLVGTAVLGAGMQLTYGTGPALIAIGGLVLGLTVLGAIIGSRG